MREQRGYLQAWYADLRGQLVGTVRGSRRTERGNVQAGFPLDAVQIRIGAGVYNDYPSPGSAKFDCYNEPPPCD